MGFSTWDAGSVTSYGFGDWQNRFPDHSGTENPKNDVEKIQRIRHLEQKIYELNEQVRNSDYKLDQAKNRVDTLRDNLSYAKDSAYNSRQRHLELGRKKAGLEGKIAGNKQHLRELKDRLEWTNDEWTKRDIKQEISRRENLRWELDSQLSDTTSSYYEATERMHEQERKVSQLETSLDQAINNVDRCREDSRLKKEKLEDYRRELSNLKGGW